MSILEIYDSQGNGIGRHEGDKNHRVETLFFDGVRLAIERVEGRTKITCFFRARESSSSRSEQYYAVYTGETGDFVDRLQKRVKDDLGMEIVTSTDDTEVFQQLQKDEPAEPPQTEQLDDVVELLNSGRSESDLESEGFDPDPSVDKSLDSARETEPAKIGAGTYRDAVAVLRYFLSIELSSGRMPSCVIAENADSSDLRHFDVIIQKGDHPGITLLDETAAAVEDMKLRKRPGEEQDGNPDDETGWFNMFTVGISIVAFLGVIVAILFAACLLGGPVPDFVPFCDTSSAEQTGNAEPSLELNATELDGEGLVIEGTLRGGKVGNTPSLQIGILESRGTENGNVTQLVNVSVDTTVENGSFQERIPAERLTDVQPLRDFGSGTYNVTVSYGAVSDAMTISRASSTLQINNATWKLNYTTGQEGGDLSLEGTLATTRSLANGTELIPVADQTPELSIDYGGSTSITVDGYENAVFDLELHNVTRPESGEEITVAYNTTETTATITVEEQPTTPTLRIDSATWDYTSGSDNGTLSVRGLLAKNRSIDNAEPDRIPVDETTLILIVSHPGGDQQLEPLYYDNGTFEIILEGIPQPDSGEEITVTYEQTSDQETVDIGDRPSGPALRIDSATWTNSSQKGTLSVSAILTETWSIDQPENRTPVDDSTPEVTIAYQNETYTESVTEYENSTFEIVVEEHTRPEETDSVRVAYDGASDTSPVGVTES